jgi:predicted O-methyltransferase YrrM
VERARRRLYDDTTPHGSSTVRTIAMKGSNPRAVAELLYWVASASGASLALELGTLLGVSSAYLAVGLHSTGRVVTVDMNERHVVRAREFLRDAGVADAVEVHQGHFTGADMERIVKERRFGLIYKDGAHNQAATRIFFDDCCRWAAPGAIILLDDVHRPELARAWASIGAVLDVTFCMTTGRTGIACLR